VLDAFCYNGQFSLLAAKCADDVISIDCSGDSLAILEENIQANHLKNITPIEGNVFDILTDYDKQNERFDTIILDPPPFAKSGSKTPGARRGYHEINSRAMRLLQPDGILATFSCSYNIGRDEFLAEIRQAAAKVHRSFSVVKELTQSSDHPTLLNTPETRYLTGFVLRMEE
jgi:23S rRNA (cytosine1962-C5)-methyltransferase